MAEITELCREQQWRIVTWSIDSGLTIDGRQIDEIPSFAPLAAIKSIGGLGADDETTIVVLQNFHRFLQSAEIVQAMMRQVIAGKQSRTICVVLAPIVQIPIELEKLFTVIEHQLPNREQLAEIARGVATEDGELPEDADLDAVLDVTVGLTRLEAENA